MSPRKHELVPTSILLIDETIYPRHKIDGTTVSLIRQALRAGNGIPPIVADRTSKTLTDGHHRLMAVRAEAGDDADNATIAVEWRDYKSRAEMVADAIRMNTAHGSNLTPWDRARCISIAADVGLEAEELARALRMTLEELESLQLERFAKGSGGSIIPIKRGMGHLAGRRLTKKQESGLDGFGGMNQTYYVNQVILMLEHDLINLESDNVVKRLVMLRDMLNGLELRETA